MEQVVFSVWMSSQRHGAPPVQRVAEHYLADNRRLQSVTSCDLKTIKRPMLSISDISSAERHVRDRFESGDWPIELEILPIAKGASLRAESRKIRIGASSIACPLDEHPVEVLLIVDNDFWDPKKARRQRRGPAKVLEEFRLLCNELSVDWALIVPVQGRGPSLPELKYHQRPSYVELSTVFLASDAFETSLVYSRASDMGWQRWERGFFGSISPTFGDMSAPASRNSVTGVWGILSSWASQQEWVNQE